MGDVEEGEISCDSDDGNERSSELYTKTAGGPLPEKPALQYRQPPTSLQSSKLNPRAPDKFLMSSDEESNSESDIDEDDVLSWKRKKTKSCAQPQDEHPQRFLEAWQHQKVQERRNSEVKRSKECKETVKNILQSPSRSSHDIRIPGNTPSNSPKMKRRKNNIWGSVMQDQVLEQGMKQSIALFEKDEGVFHDRGVENYNFEKAQEDTRDFETPVAETRSQDELFEVRQNVNDPFQKILEAEGLKPRQDEDEDETSERTPEGADNEANGVDMEEGDGRRGLSRKRAYDDEGRRRKKHGVNIKDRIGPKEFDPSMTCEVEDDDDRVVEVIQNRLREQKKHLIIKVVETMGKKFALNKLCETEEVEKNGGMMTADNKRRRTPGGVYLQLMKQDSMVTKDQRDSIFGDDKRLENVKKKEFRRQKLVSRGPLWRERYQVTESRECKGDMEVTQGGEVELGNDQANMDDSARLSSRGGGENVDEEFGGDSFAVDEFTEKRNLPSPIEELF